MPLASCLSFMTHTWSLMTELFAKVTALSVHFPWPIGNRVPCLQDLALAGFWYCTMCSWLRDTCEWIMINTMLFYCCPCL